MGQRPVVRLAIHERRVQLVLQLRITRQGHEVLRAIDLESTGDPVADGWLAGALDAFAEAMRPFRSGRQAGSMLGEGLGSCRPSAPTSGWRRPRPPMVGTGGPRPRRHPDPRAVPARAARCPAGAYR